MFYTLIIGNSLQQKGHWSNDYNAAQIQLDSKVIILCYDATPLYSDG